jgi:hypothetical protein
VPAGPRSGLLAGVAALVAAVIYGPMLLPGFPLRYDLVSVPRPVLGEDALGLGDRLPRAIPLDAAVAMLSKVLPDNLLTQLLGLLALTLAGWGVAVLTPASTPGRLLALLVAEWNPFVLEQLAIGHLPHLLGYGALPWVAVFGRALVRPGSGPGPASRIRADRVRAWGGMTAAAGFGSLTPGGGALVVIAGLAGLLAGWWARPSGAGGPGSAAGSATAGGSATANGSPTAGGPGSAAGSATAGGSGTADDGSGAVDGRGLAGGSGLTGGPGGPGSAGLDAGRGWRVLAGLGSLGVLQLPWLIAAAAAPAFAGPTGAADSGITAFALNSETGWGRLVDAAGLAGMWNEAALPASRGTVLARVSTVLLLGLAVAGLPAVRRFWRAGHRAEPLAALLAASAGYLIAVLPVLPGGESLLRTLIEVMPGAGLLRDGHRWLGLPAIIVAVLCGLGAMELSRLALGPSVSGSSVGRTSAGGVEYGIALFAALLVIASIPDLAGGLAGSLRARQYPAQWAQVRAVLERSDDRARVLVLPWQPFRVFGWSGPDPILDPAPRLLPRQSIVSDALTVADQRLPEEGLGALAIAADLADGALSDGQLRSLAIGWVLIEHGTPGRLPALPPGWTAVLAGPDLSLLRAPDPLPAAPRAGTTRTIAVIGSQSAAGLLFLAGLAALILSGVRRSPGRRFRPSSGHPPAA